MIRILFFFIFFLSGCSYVSSQHPVGLENYPLKADEWNGIWLNEDGTVKIKVLDEINSIVQIAWIEIKKNELQLESVKAKILKGEKWLYANVQDEINGQSEKLFFWAKIKKETKKIILWYPSIDSFREAVETNKIKGIIIKQKSIDGTREIIDNIKLTDDSRNIVFLLENNDSKYIKWEEPLTLIKISD